MAERFEATTTVRRPRIVLMWAIGVAMAAIFACMLALRLGALQLPYMVLAPLIAAVQRRPRSDVLQIAASPEGLRIGAELVPRAKLKGALLRREGDRRFVRVRGAHTFGSSADIEVGSDEDADRLCDALGLDAKSTTAEFTMARAGQPVSAGFVVALFAAIGASTGFVIAARRSLALALVFGTLALITGGAALLVFLRRQTKLVIGADGIVVKHGFDQRTFVPHDDIVGVDVEGMRVALRLRHGPPLVFVAGNERQSDEKGLFDARQEAQAIAWRIQKAQQVYAALAGEAPAATLALDRGQKTTREWIEQLKRVGEGANATFREVGLTREQLLRVVESTSAAAKERLAAAVALRSGLTDEEKPRIRVAAERCVAPDLRERMVRVAFAEGDDELAEALDDEISADVAARR